MGGGQYCPQMYNVTNTGLCYHNRIVFEEMSSWTDLTVHLWMKTTFYTKYVKQICSDFYYDDLKFS